MIIGLASFLVAFGILLLFIGLGVRTISPDPMQRVMNQLETGPRSLEELEMSRPLSERVLLPLLRSMARIVNRFTPQQNLDLLRRRLQTAGNPNNWTVVDFLGVRGLAAVAGTLLALAFAYVGHASLGLTILLLVGMTFLGFYLPLLWLTMRGRARQAQIQRELPDALDLLSISVEAGLGLDAAMQRVTQKWDNELSGEFARVLTEVRVGKLRRDALHDMSERVDVDDLSNFIAAVIQAEQLGVSITKVMRIQAEQMRIKRRQRAQEKAQQAPIKMLIPMGFLIFPSMFIVILGPSVLRLLSGGIIPK